MAGVYRIVEIDAGENGENVGLQEGDQELERREHDDEDERQGRAEPAKDAKPGEHEGCFVYRGNSQEPFLKAYEDAGWELETRILCQLGVRLQFKAKSG